jgi:hypothetical protein
MNTKIVKALVDVLVLIDLAPDDQIDPDFAVSLQENGACAFDSLTNDEQQALVGIVAEMATSARPGPSRDRLRAFAENYALLDDEQYPPG